MTEVSNKTGGISFGGLLFILFLALKLTGVINWSWFWVFSPILFPLIVVLFIILLVICFG